MIISHKFKCIFIRIPKTGSTSIEVFLKEFDPDCISSDDNSPPYGHFYASQLKKMVESKIWNTYFKFTIIREPLDWFKSLYKDNMKFSHKKNEKIHILLNDDYMLEKPFENILSVDQALKLYILQGNWFNGNNQMIFLDEDLDFIGKFEDFNKIIEYLKNKFNIKSDKNYHYNKSNLLNLSFSEDCEKILKILYKNDIAFYNNLTNLVYK